MNYIRVVRMRRSKDGRMSHLSFASVFPPRAEVRSSKGSRVARVYASDSIAVTQEIRESLGAQQIMHDAKSPEGKIKVLTVLLEVADAIFRFLRLMVLIPLDAVCHPFRESHVDHERGIIVTGSAQDE